MPCALDVVDEAPGLLDFIATGEITGNEVNVGPLDGPLHLQRRNVIGQHALRVEPLDGGRTRFVCKETFSGLLLPLVAGNLERSVGPRYRETCEALKFLVEKEQGQGTQGVE